MRRGSPRPGFPRLDVPQTKAMDEAGVMLDMAELAEADPSALAAGLEPLLDGYDDLAE